MRFRTVLILGAASALAMSLQADILKLKSGAGVQGTLISANSRQIAFLSVDGVSKTYPINSVSGIDFAPLPAPPEPKPAPAAAPPLPQF